MISVWMPYSRCLDASSPISYSSSGISHTALRVRHPVGFLLGAAIQG